MDPSPLNTVFYRCKVITIYVRPSNLTFYVCWNELGKQLRLGRAFHTPPARTVVDLRGSDHWTGLGTYSPGRKYLY